jgi:2-hydroxychromene-2-carboxylate isomerase
MWRDMERICADAGLVFHKPSNFPRGSILAARVAAAHAGATWIGPFVRAVYTANFAEDRNIGEAAVIADILAGLGQDAEGVIATAQSPDGKAALRAHTDEAQARGLFGAPSLLVGDELFWGHDRLDQAIAWAARG